MAIELQCPVPLVDHENVLLAHGGGGRLSHELLERMIVPVLGNDLLAARHDGAALQIGGARLAFTTDSFVVRPHVFPGGDIGSLAVNGTVNDLAMCGARPLYLSAALILEEGFPMAALEQVLRSMRAAADAVGVSIVTGDTKVVDRGKGDGIFVNTAGIGAIEHGRTIAPASVREGDVVLLSGDLGRHGTAILAAREGLEFESRIESDCAPLWSPVARLLAAGVEVRCLRDLTRGGLASAVLEIAEAARVSMALDEPAIPVEDGVRGACEILGLDPMYVANEGRFVAFVAPADADRALEILAADPACVSPARIGTVVAGRAGMVSLKTALGTSRIVDMFSGEQLPRIC